MCVFRFVFCVLVVRVRTGRGLLVRALQLRQAAHRVRAQSALLQQPPEALAQQPQARRQAGEGRARALARALAGVDERVGEEVGQREVVPHGCDRYQANGEGWA